MWSQRSRFSGFIKDTYSSCAGVHHQSLNTQTANLPPDHQLLDYHAANRNAISIIIRHESCACSDQATSKLKNAVAVGQMDMNMFNVVQVLAP